jgi:GH18 family chitinase
VSRSIIVTAALALAACSADSRSSSAQSPLQQGDCRPDGLHQTPGTAPPYCTVYDAQGLESSGRTRRVIGYFTSWRHGKNGQPAYLVSDIPWDRVTHLNYAFAHIDAAGHLSVGADGANNPSTGMEWPGVIGAELDPSLPFKGHFNLLARYKRAHPKVKTLISIGGWAESGGFFPLTVRADGSINQPAIDGFADSVVAFLRRYQFDGADIDYEYPTSMSGAGNPIDFALSNPRRPALMAGYVALMKTLRARLDAASTVDGRHYLLTAAVSASGWILRGSEGFAVTPYLDFANLMTYDLHGAWNHFVGPNAALFDDGRDGELTAAGVYSAYNGIGYLNTDWAYHYFRGALPPSRINLGVPFYTRGWRNVTGGTDGLWGTAALADQTRCPLGTGGGAPCGDGAVGIDNLWHDLGRAGGEEASGSNPLWHARNLETGRPGSYRAAYGLDVNDTEDQLTGSYARRFSRELAAPWLWNASKKVFLSTEDEESLAYKLDYVIQRKIGGVMIWELAGDYDFDPSRANGQGEYFIGSSLLRLISGRLWQSPPANPRLATAPMPTDPFDAQVELVGFPLGDQNYPIAPRLKITNRSGAAIPGGARLSFDVGTSTPDRITQQSGWPLTLLHCGHTGPNRGGLQGDHHRVQLELPGWTSIAPGASAEVALSYPLPITRPSNFTLEIAGTKFALPQDHPRAP